VDGWFTAGAAAVGIGPILGSLKSIASLEEARLEADVIGLKTLVPLLLPPSAISFASLIRLDIIVLLLLLSI